MGCLPIWCTPDLTLTTNRILVALDWTEFSLPRLRAITKHRSIAEIELLNPSLNLAIREIVGLTVDNSYPPGDLSSLAVTSFRGRKATLVKRGFERLRAEKRDGKAGGFFCNA